MAFIGCIVFNLWWCVYFICVVIGILIQIVNGCYWVVREIKPYYQKRKSDEQNNDE